MAIKDRTKVFSKYKKMGVMLYEKLTTNHEIYYVRKLVFKFAIKWKQPFEKMIWKFGIEESSFSWVWCLNTGWEMREKPSVCGGWILLVWAVMCC